MNYTYSKGDLLETSQKYQLSPFHGNDFLNSYKIDRESILNQLDSKITKKIALSQLIENLLPSENTMSEKPVTKFVTKTLLITLLNKPQLTSNDKIVLLKLLKSFEIKKKIFTKYDLSQNTFSIDFKNITNYILFSLLCNKEFNNTRNLKYLNAVLKLNDIISSYFQTIFSKIDHISENFDSVLAFHAISLELSCINTLKKL